MAAVTQARLLSLLPAAALAACVATPARAPLEPASTLQQFNARRLESLQPELPPPSAGWNRAQWLAAALRLNPQLAEERAEVAAVAAAERTAAQRPNPHMQLFGEYLTSAAQSTAWLYGLSLEFLLRQPGARERARRQAALETALAQSDLAESIWQVRAALRQALLDGVSAHDEALLLDSLVAERQALLDTDRARVQAGDLGSTQVLADELELSRARERQREAAARGADAMARLAAAVGVPVAALQAVPLRWDGWAAIGTLQVSAPGRARTEALIGRPQIVHALREYDLAEIGLQSEVARRWPEVHLTPAYAWGGDGLRSERLYDIASEGGAALTFELPLLNQHQGEIGEALARRAAAGEHLKAVQARIFGEIDRTELAWPAAQAAWADKARAAEIAERQRQAEQRALAAGMSDRTSVLTARIAALEAQLSVLQAAYAAEVALGTLEDAYHRPLEGPESPWPPAVVPHS